MSYGRNSWAIYPQPDEIMAGGNMANGINANDCWKEPNISNAANTPWLLDAAWVEVWATPANAVPTPPSEEQMTGDTVRSWGMALFCLDRHPKHTVNALMLDSSVRNVGIKELWTLEWNNKFDTRNIYTKTGGMTPAGWPDWMQGFKDY